MEVLDEDLDSSPRTKGKGDDMNVIKAYIGNLLYEKWFIENFTKNTDQLDKLPTKVLSKLSKP